MCAQNVKLRMSLNQYFRLELIVAGTNVTEPSYILRNTPFYAEKHFIQQTVIWIKTDFLHITKHRIQGMNCTVDLQCGVSVSQNADVRL